MKAHNQKLGKRMCLFGAGCCLSLPTLLIRISWCASTVPGRLFALSWSIQHPQAPCLGTALTQPMALRSHRSHTGCTQGFPLHRDVLVADGSVNTRGSYLCCSKTPTFSFRQEVMFTIDWIHHKLLIITIISALIL